jgi:hypothetical protein
MDNKLYGKLSGRCNLHGANHFGGRNPIKNGQRYICEVTADCAHCRTTKFGKRFMRRQARRFYKKELKQWD